MRNTACVVAVLFSLCGCGVGELETGGTEALGSVEDEARASYNCNRDKKLDAAGSFTFEVLSAAKLRLKLTTGSDSAGIGDYSYTLTDASGAATSLGATRLTCFGTETLSDGFVDGLTPGGKYTVTLTTSDKCGNTVTTAPLGLVMRSLTSETNGPTVATFGLSSVNWFGSQVPVLRAQVEDDTGMDRVEFYSDGVLVGTDTLKKTGGLWSTTLGFYTAPGANYFMYPKRGETHTFEARAYDLLGNTSSVFKELTVP